MVTNKKQRPGSISLLRPLPCFYSPFRRKRGLLFRFFRDDRLEEGVGRHHLPLVGREPDHAGAIIGELGFHQIKLVADETVKGVCIFMDLLQCFFIYLISAVLSNVLIEHVDDLLFHLTVPRM